ncbi:MAG TPA: molybdopterin molybdotransferase MoeA [Opitutaceae bacterium]|jgi:molybdopterin molybdotransferase
MVTPAEAQRLIWENLAPWPREECPLALAHGRVLQMLLKADRDLPPFDRVTMDGYALRSSAFASGVRTFQVEGVQAAGAVPQTLSASPQACVEVMTGSVLPPGADCVVPYEDVTRTEGTIGVAAALDLKPGTFVHGRGSDHRAGETIVPSGTRLSGREIAVAAACGFTTLTVSRIPQVAVVATGDELVEVEAEPEPHQIRRSNDYALRAALMAAGYTRTERFHLRDLRVDIQELLRQVLGHFDAVLFTGGVSKGQFDFLPSELEKQNVRRVLQGVAQRPGRPFWFGVSARSVPVFALPGNPASAYTCLHRYVLPAFDRCSGLAPRRPEFAALASPFRFRPALACLLPVRLSSAPDARLLAEPVPGNTSGDFAGLVETDGFVELPVAVQDFPAGYVAPLYRWV